MNKTLLIISTAIVMVIIGSSAIDAPNRASYADGSRVTGYSGGCTCHTAGTKAGAIVLSGLDTTVLAGQTYPISIIMFDSTAKRWGFDMSVPTGTFTTTNANAALTGTRNIHHGSSAPYGTTTSYKVDSIFWTAPTKAGKVTFKFACNAANGDGLVGGDHTYKGTFATTVVVPTPINLKSFTANLVGSEVSLQWVTATELNVGHFEIERSTDNQTFISVKSVLAAGNASSAKNYTFSENVSAFTGFVYYRLKTVDKTGVTSYSAIEAVEVKAKNNLITSIYPNPTHSGQSIHFSYSSEKVATVAFSVVNTLGKKLFTQNISVSKGTNLLTLPIGSLAAGKYILTASVNNVLVSSSSLLIQ